MAKPNSHVVIERRCISSSPPEPLHVGVLLKPCRFQYIDAQWPYLRENNIHCRRDDIQWLPVQHAVVEHKQMNAKHASIINSVIGSECSLGDNVTVQNSIVRHRITLGNNCSIQSVDFSKEVGIPSMPSSLPLIALLFCFSRILISRFRPM